MLRTLSLRGRNALSEFRSNKLNAALQQARLKLSALSAEYWHFVSVSRALTPDESAILERILTYGPVVQTAPEAGHMQLVVPRLGTISPWSSKATDIARQCGLPAVDRIERQGKSRNCCH
jgi:phosphoribosylformylglycinamidine synthase